MRKIALAGLCFAGVSAALSLTACSSDPRPPGGPKTRTVAYYRDPMHPSYTSDRPGKAPDCGMDLEPVYADAADAAGVAPVTAAQRQLMGLKLGRVERSRVTGSLRTLGRVALDENRVFPVRAGGDGYVTRIFPHAATGDVVRKGQPLASVYGREYTTAQRSFLYALRASENPPPAVPGEDASQPTLTLQEARIFLTTIGVGDAQIAELAKTRQVMLDVSVTAPAAGVIVARSVFPQQHFDKDVELFRIADFSRVWIVAKLLGDDQVSIPSGTTARVVPQGRSGPDMKATVSEALGRFDGASRSLELRLEADNPGRVLRPDMFVDLEFSITLPEATNVPSDAVVESGLSKTVYVEANGGRFEPRAVTTGWRFGGRVEIVAGLTPGESIVVSGSALLDSQTRMRRGDAGVHD
jgi:hypothetical protein